MPLVPSYVIDVSNGRDNILHLSAGRSSHGTLPGRAVSGGSDLQICLK